MHRSAAHRLQPEGVGGPPAPRGRRLALADPSLPAAVVSAAGPARQIDVTPGTSLPGRRVALFLPRVGVVVVAVALPEAAPVLGHQFEAAHPLRALPEVEKWV